MTARDSRRGLIRAVLLAASGFGLSPSFAEGYLRVENAWARATVPGQQVGAAYLALIAGKPMRLVQVETPAAKTAQIHSMSNDGGVMRMRQLQSVELPAGQVVGLDPGGTHLMLLGLKQPLADGQVMQLTLTLEDDAGHRSTRSVDVPVRRAPVR